MLTISNTTNFRIEKPCVATIGTFDGVHLGHQKLLQQLNKAKQTLGLQTVVLTFDPHPRKVLFPEQTDLKLLSLTNEKLDLLKNYGVDVSVVYPFNKAFAGLEAEQYVSDILIKMLNVKHLIIGYDHKFGKNREGNFNLLKQLSLKYNFTVEEISAKDIDNITISSSKIRKAIEFGDVELAKNYLGHYYFTKALVIKGKQLGSKIGFPTANLKVMDTDKLIPNIGVYFVSVEIETKIYYGMMNIGTNPTVESTLDIKQEVNIFDFEGDLYNQTIKINFIKRLRNEIKFDNLEQLILQIKNDKQMCLNLMK
ncbi:MAG: bifunctional riboflavin kinase/FAD synthetase [Bacteroidetes bacterium]|nr:bifunctional riboflavin kinase/FAD synthetase [Bacteroidota bacterium]